MHIVVQDNLLDAVEVLRTIVLDVPKCRAELHVCKLCVDYDTRVAKHCREPTVEEVRDKEKANFCDYFKPRSGAYTPADQAAIDKSKAALAALFGK